MTTDVYPRENCIAPAIVLIVYGPRIVVKLALLLTVKTLLGMTTNVYIPPGELHSPVHRTHSMDHEHKE